MFPFGTAASTQTMMMRPTVSDSRSWLWKLDSPTQNSPAKRFVRGELDLVYYDQFQNLFDMWFLTGPGLGRQHFDLVVSELDLGPSAVLGATRRCSGSDCFLPGAGCSYAEEVSSDPGAIRSEVTSQENIGRVGRCGKCG